MEDLNHPITVAMPGFDEEFYRSENPSLHDYEGSLLQHYLEIGWKYGYKPSFGFDGERYLMYNFDVKSANICPLVHFLNYGLSEGRDGWRDPDLYRSIV